MSAYSTVQLPFKIYGNKQVILREDADRERWIREFIERFPDSFEYDSVINGWVFRRARAE